MSPSASAAIWAVCMLSLAGCAATSTASARPYPVCRGAEDLPDPLLPPVLIPGQFNRTGGSLACVLSNEAGRAMAERQAPVTFLSCLRVGPVGVGDERVTVEALLGQADQVTILDDQTEAMVYPVVQRTLPQPYYVITYRKNVAVAVQLLGPPSDMPQTFSGLGLGDPEEKVVETLGKPAQRCQSQRGGPQTWLWPSFPIAVDVADGVITGLKVTWPVGAPRP